ncbi:MAG: 2-oxoacid:acceptor oxidoreductase family protein [Candidatus Bathyarchaeia archaeon]
MVLAGQILGKAAVYDGKNVVQTQSYGAEARGTTAKSEVIISEDKIGFPIVRKCDILVAMSQEALEGNIKDLKEDGILLVDISMVKNIPKANAKIYAVPATEISEEISGQKLYANMVILGALIKIANLVNGKSLNKAIKDTLPKNVISINLQLCKKGVEFVSANPLI